MKDVNNGPGGSRDSKSCTSWVLYENAEHKEYNKYPSPSHLKELPYHAKTL